MPKRKAGRVPVTMRALVQRINRRLKADQKMLKATRGARALQEVGAYYVLDWDNRIVSMHVDPEALGRKLRVLSAFEYVISEEDE